MRSGIWFISSEPKRAEIEMANDTGNKLARANTEHTLNAQHTN
jgi:hypothetical protein